MKHPELSQDRTRVDRSVNDVSSFAGRASFLVQIYGDNIGHRFAIDKPLLTLGRDEQNDVVLAFDNVSRHHAEILKNETQFVVVDKESTNGTFVNDTLVRKEKILSSGDLIKIGRTIFKFISGTDVEGLYFEEIYRMTIIDGLTEVHNKRYFNEFLEREMARCRRYHRPLSLMMFDLDHFKKINDSHGHLAGDSVLKRVASLANEKVRKEELLARYGGEEFAIVMPETDIQHSAIFAEKLRCLIQQEKFVYQTITIPVTMSVGIGQMKPEHMTTADFIRFVDAALYAAKHHGRNRVEQV